MISFIDPVVTLVAVVLLVPVATLSLQIFAAVLLRPRKQELSDLRPSVAVLVPAHDESKMIGATVRALLPQIHPGDRLVVVADNCTDDTAEIAERLGAKVIVRDDPERRGKGFALARGIEFLAASGPPDVVVFVDADCQALSGSVARLAALAHSTGRPVQGDYVLTAEGSNMLSVRFGEFALRLRNRVRPLGCLNMGLPCPLTGSGMAIAWRTLTQISLASDNIVEDLALGVDLALAGAPPLFCPSAGISSSLPASDNGRDTQRKRWEQGHLTMIGRYAPRLLWQGFVKRQWTLAAVALDICVPPLALLSTMLFGAWVLSAFWWLIGGSPLPFRILFVAQALLCVSIFVTWWTNGRDLISSSELAYIPVYVFRKIPLYAGLILGKRIGWVRTDRS